MNDDRSRVDKGGEGHSGGSAGDWESACNDDDRTIGQFEPLFLQFERDCKEGKRPRISAYLEEVGPAFRLKVLRELILVDFGLAEESGASPNRGDYLAQFSRADERAVARIVLAERYSDPPTVGQSEPVVRVGDYEVEGELSRGGMGATYKARHMVHGRPVVIKTILPEYQSVKGVVDRFGEEIKNLTKLPRKHPNVVLAYDGRGADSGGHRLPFIVMEYIEGVDLRRELEGRGRLEVAEACDLARQVAEGLGYLHKHKVVHRDIKPSNIILDSDKQAVIVDLGIALDIGADSHLTLPGQAIGTPDYISPEAATDPHGVDHRADIYSLGCTLYHFLAGRPPFHDRQSLAMRLIAHLGEEPSPLEELRPDLPAGLADVVRKMMAKRPEDRYQTTHQVVEAMEPYCKPITPPPPPPPPPSPPPPLWILAAVVAALLILAGTVVVLRDNHRNRHEELTFEAWSAYEQKDYQAAIGHANLCIREFKGPAERLQTKLLDERAEIPLGKVPPKDQERVFENGLLNDVATCLWVKGRSHEELKQLADARQAYEQAKLLTYARCWNKAEGLFWSPAEKAGDDLANLEDLRKPDRLDERPGPGHPGDAADSGSNSYQRQIPRRKE